MALNHRVLALSPGYHGCDRTLTWLAQGVVNGGVRLLVLREPHLSHPAYVELARRLSPELGSGLILHTSHPGAIEIAAAAGWGLHMNGSTDWAATRAEISGLLGASCHTLEQVQSATDAGCDYITVSPVFSPFSKPIDERKPLGLEGLNELVEATHVPVFGLGGIDGDRAPSIRDQGAHGVASMGFLFPIEADSDDCEERATKLVRAVG